MEFNIYGMNILGEVNVLMSHVDEEHLVTRLTEYREGDLVMTFNRRTLWVWAENASCGCMPEDMIQLQMALQQADDADHRR